MTPVTDVELRHKLAWEIGWSYYLPTASWYFETSDDVIEPPDYFESIDRLLQDAWPVLVKDGFVEWSISAIEGGRSDARVWKPGMFRPYSATDRRPSRALGLAFLDALKSSHGSMASWR